MKKSNPNPKRPTTTPEEISKIRELSPDHPAKTISELTGVSEAVILKIQLNPKFGIVNPYRKYPNKYLKKVKTDFSRLGEDGELYFDEDEYFKTMNH